MNLIHILPIYVLLIHLEKRGRPVVIVLKFEAWSPRVDSCFGRFLSRFIEVLRRHITLAWCGGRNFLPVTSRPVPSGVTQGGPPFKERLSKVGERQ